MLSSSLIRRLCFLPGVAALAIAARAADQYTGRQVVLIVWDGMRPDFVTEPNTPHLWALAQAGVFFANHHPVYLSSTEVNGTAMATGEYPAHSHVIANTDYRPRIDPAHTVGIEVPAVIRKGDEVSGGHYLATPTVAEILHAHGLATVVAGSKDVALLHDRAVRADAPGVSPVLFQGESEPPALAAALTAAQGAFPTPGKPDDKRNRDDWTTQALIGTLWQDGVPPYTLLWLAEPDSTQHVTAPGSPESLAAIKHCDDILGRIQTELDRRGLRATTDVLVVSDHGFSTISRKVDVAAELAGAGFDARRSVAGGLQPGQVMVVSDGGSSLLYVGGHDAAVCARLAAWLQRQDWTGVLFARAPLDGTFPLTTAHLDAPAAPDLVVALRWSVDKSANGTPGMVVSDLKATSAKIGNHASLSRYDMHNTLVAGGPDFRSGVRDPLPSANCDVGPTILWILGVRDEVAKMDGRVLGEALTGAAPPLRSFDLRHLTASRPLGDGRTWTQYLDVSEVNGVDYFDAGNGTQTAAP
ncbi:MAG TPA: alkaline phosphatase family protein [Opitutaceae bacterium]|nr:alkaline phosphatase family protein [Opitutaceae bacterium]